MTAPDGENALKIHGQKKTRIDLVLMDLIMPGMGGKKCIQKLLETDPDLRIVIASGYSPDDPTTQYTDLGARGYLRKPYIGLQLLRMVRKVLDSQ